MIAGPNGSGKSTLKDRLRPEWLGVYVNADDIERAISLNDNSLALAPFLVETETDELRTYFRGSSLMSKAGLLADAERIRVESGAVIFDDVAVNSYHAAVLADFIRRKLVDAGISLTFETVMSSRDKIDFVCDAQSRGYRTYLYFVATDSPRINIDRVGFRVGAGGHPVPEDKIVERYARTLSLLKDAVKCSNRAYVFDNSRAELVLLAEVTDGDDLRIAADEVNRWFSEALLT